MKVNNRLYRLFSTTTQPTKFDHKRISEQIKKLNEEAKTKTLDKKSDKLYITKMSPDRIEKIGSQTLLDK
jgi:hypothetical protein